jgi:aspartate racemase
MSLEHDEMAATLRPMRRIGILGGSSDQSTAEYYRLLNRAVSERLGGWNTAELLISSMNFARAEYCVRNGLWDEVGAYLAERALALERGGADLIICVSNTLHRVAGTFTAPLSIPFLHIADPTGEAMRTAGLRRVGLLGTKPVMAGDHIKHYYRERFGVEAVVPSEADQDAVDRIIFDELCRGVFTSDSKARYLDVIDELIAEGAEGVVLGCTEIPLLIAQADRPAVPMFNTTQLHVEAAVRLALDDDKM